jgi:hypothetical protein
MPGRGLDGVQPARGGLGGHGKWMSYILGVGDFYLSFAGEMAALGVSDTPLHL